MVMDRLAIAECSLQGEYLLYLLILASFWEPSFRLALQQSLVIKYGLLQLVTMQLNGGSRVHSIIISRTLSPLARDIAVAGTHVRGALVRLRSTRRPTRRVHRLPTPQVPRMGCNSGW